MPELNDEKNLVMDSGTIEPIYPQKTLVKSLILNLIIWGITGLLHHLMFWIISLYEEGITSLVYAIIWEIVGGGIVIIVLPTYLYSIAYTHSFKYEISQKFIIIYQGVFTKTKMTIPFSRIQNISVNQGLIDRMYGLFTVKIETAGFSGTSSNSGKTSPEGTIPGIRSPKKLEQIINQLVHDYTQAPYDNLKGKVFDQRDLAFDEFAAYFLDKIMEGGSMKNRIKELRESKKLTQAELADKVDVTRATIYNLEAGRFLPSIKLAMLIADILGVRVDELFLLDNIDKKDKK